MKIFVLENRQYSEAIQRAFQMQCKIPFSLEIQDERDAERFRKKLPLEYDAYFLYFPYTSFDAKRDLTERYKSGREIFLAGRSSIHLPTLREKNTGVVRNLYDDEIGARIAVELAILSQKVKS